MRPTATNKFITGLLILFLAAFVPMQTVFAQTSLCNASDSSNWINIGLVDIGGNAMLQQDPNTGQLYYRDQPVNWDAATVQTELSNTSYNNDLVQQQSRNGGGGFLSSLLITAAIVAIAIFAPEVFVAVSPEGGVSYLGGVAAGGETGGVASLWGAGPAMDSMAGVMGVNGLTQDAILCVAGVTCGSNGGSVSAGLPAGYSYTPHTCDINASNTTTTTNNPALSGSTAVRCIASPTNPKVGDTVTWSINPVDVTAYFDMGNYVFHSYFGPSSAYQSNPDFGNWKQHQTSTTQVYSSPGWQYADLVFYTQYWNDPPGRAEENCSVYVSPAPAPSVSCSGSPGNPFINQPVTWSSSVTGGSGTYTYVWSGTDDLFDTVPTTQKSYSTAGAKQASLSVTDASSGKTASAACINGETGGASINVQSCTSSLSANPDTVEQGQNTSLSWSVSGGGACASSCSGSGFNTGGAISGTVNATVPPTPPTTTYSLTCTRGAYGPPPPANTTVTVLVPKATVTANGQSTSARVNPAIANNTNVVWSSEHVASCTVTKNGVAWKTDLNSAGTPDTVTTQTIYAIDCVNHYGVHAISPTTNTNSVIVNVLPGFNEF